MKSLKTSNLQIVAMCIAMILSSFGGIVIGFNVQNTLFIAIFCLIAGISISCLMNEFLRYTNLAWILWLIMIFVIVFNSANNGEIAEPNWLRPVVILYAIGCYIMLKLEMRKHNN